MAKKDPTHGERLDKAEAKLDVLAEAFANSFGGDAFREKFASAGEDEDESGDADSNDA